jgi:predicted glycosyltransferase
VAFHLGQKRFIFYSHDGLGLGHVRRNIAIAAAMVEQEPRSSILMITGCPEADRLGLPPNADVLRLPSLRKLGNARYSSRRLPMTGVRLRCLRASQIAAAVQSLDPAVILVDRHPLGVGEELRDALEVLRDRGGAAALGLRDVIDEPAAVQIELEAEGWADAVARYYDLVLVYGSATLLDQAEVYRFPPAVTERIAYTGYVVHPAATGRASVDGLPGSMQGPRPRPLVLATAGGGEDGGRLYRNFVEAANGAPWDGLIVTGPDLPSAEALPLRVQARQAGVEVYRFADNLPAWLDAVDALVCMGGYNTLCEAGLRGVPTVCVPRVFPRTEQLIRARIFAGAQRLRLLDPAHLDPVRLASAVAGALLRAGLPPPANGSIEYDGARRAATRLLALARAGRAPRGPDSTALQLPV